MTTSEPRQRSANDIALSRRLSRLVLPPILALTALNGAAQVAGPPRGTAVSAVVWGLQILPALWLARSLVRCLGSADEWQRLAVLESLAYGFVAAMLVLFAGSQFEAAGVGAGDAPLRVAHAVALDAGIVVPLAALFVKGRRAG